MKFENTEVWGFEHAIRGMRNPMNSWDKSDSFWEDYKCIRFGDKECTKNFIIGENDLKLAQKLIKGGSEHRKFMRQIFVSVDITAPLYWWKEFDTYKVGTVVNSTSTMHKIDSKPITLECFEIDDYKGTELLIDETEVSLDWDVKDIIDVLEALRQKYLETKDKRYWKELIRWLPESWLQTRTVTMTYENIYSMLRQRYTHKLNEWSGLDDNTLPNFKKWVNTLPYANELLFLGLKKETFNNDPK